MWSVSSWIGNSRPQAIPHNFKHAPANPTRNLQGPSTHIPLGNGHDGMASWEISSAQDDKTYWSDRDEISAYNEVLFKSHQVIIPASLRPEMLTKIHRAHQGPDSSIRRAQESLLARNASTYTRDLPCLWHLCSVPGRTTSRTNALSLNTHASMVKGQHRYIQTRWEILPSHCDCFELDSLKCTTTSTVIRAIKRNFARHGIPDECITDNAVIQIGVGLRT